MYNNLDIRVKIEDNGFDVRACGILVNDDKILLSTESDGTITLPGGAVKMGETTTEAAIREIEEESGLAVKSSGLLSIVENFSDYKDSPYQQLIFVYNLEFANESTRTQELGREKKCLLVGMI